MARVKTGTTRRRRHNKISQAAKGFRGHRRRSIRGAKEGILHALSYAYRSRRLKKRDMRRLWIQRINAATREQGLSYSEFVNRMKSANIELDRKILSEIAIADPDTFQKIVETVKEQTVSS